MIRRSAANKHRIKYNLKQQTTAILGSVMGSRAFWHLVFIDIFVCPAMCVRSFIYFASKIGVHFVMYFVLLFF